MSTAASRAAVQAPVVDADLDPSMPRCWAQATPPIATVPAGTVASGLGVSIRDIVLIGACSAQPRWTQYGS